MTDLLSGMLTAGYLIAGLHFLKFHHRSRDRLFLIFALAFWMLAAQRAALSVLPDVSAASMYLYSMRVAAFLLIIAAIIDKNRSPAPTRAHSRLD